MRGADGLGWAGAASAQRASQVVSTTQTPGPSQTRQAQRSAQAKDIRPACACVFILSTNRHVALRILNHVTPQKGTVSTHDPYHMLAVICWTKEVYEVKWKPNRKQEKEMFSSSSSFCPVNRLMAFYIYQRPLRGTRPPSCKPLLWSLFIYIRVFMSSCNNPKLHCVCGLFIVMPLCMSKWLPHSTVVLNRASVYLLY